MTGGGASAGTQKMVEKLEKSVEAGSYYEAQQMYKSVYARYLGQQKHDAAKELLLSGACAQLKHGQVNCGSELGVLYVEALTATHTPCDSQALERIGEVYECFPRGEAAAGRAMEEAGAAAGQGEGSETGGASQVVDSKGLAAARVQGCTAFLKAAIRWSANHGGPRSGAPQLHDMLAEYLWTQSPTKDLAAAAKHFVHGSKPEAFASALIDAMRECYPGEVDLVLARGVLQYLALGNLGDANKLLHEVHRRPKNLSAPPVSGTPLMHFIKFLLLTLERDALPLFRMLRNRYRPSLDRDPIFSEYLDEVAWRFYHVRKPSGMLGDIMKMLSGED